jgi:hypothetical protein
MDGLCTDGLCMNVAADLDASMIVNRGLAGSLALAYNGG